MSLRPPRDPEDLQPTDVALLENIGEGRHGRLVGNVYRLEDGSEIPEPSVRSLVERGLLEIGRPFNPDVPEDSVSITLTLDGEDALG